MNRPAGDFATRVVMWGLTLLSTLLTGLLLLWARDLLDVHKDHDKRIGALERQVTGLQIQVDFNPRHHQRRD